MRSAVGILLLACSLSQLGCQLPGRGKGGAAGSPNSGSNPAPFLGTPPADSPPPADTNNLTSGGTTTRRSGVLAGRIIDQDYRLRPDAIIQVIDLEASRDGAAPLAVKANRDGYFDITGLEAGHSYRLVARVKDGSRILVGTRRVVPPDIRVAIFLADEMPAGSAEQPAAASGEHASGPAASLGTPLRSDGVTTPLPGSPPPEPTRPGTAGLPPPVNTTADPSLIAKDKDRPPQDGFPRDSTPAPANIAGPGRDHKPEKSPDGPYAPPTPPISSEGKQPDPPLPTSSAPMATPIPAGPSAGPAPADPAPPSDAADGSGAASGAAAQSRAVVPSCVRVGNRVENLALYDVRGNPFELTRDRKGKLVLLDFWFSDCGPCRRAIPKLNTLQAKYGRHGLEVIGITYEQGTLAEKQQTLEGARRRYGLNPQYRLLFGGGGKGNCPVAEQLEVFRYPTLVLLDEQGRILLRVQGLDDYSAYQLEMTIYKKLFPTRLAGQR